MKELFEEYGVSILYAALGLVIAKILLDALGFINFF